MVSLLWKYIEKKVKERLKGWKGFGNFSKSLRQQSLNFIYCSIGKMPLQCILGGTPLAVDFKSLAINPIQKNIPRAALFHSRWSSVRCACGHYLSPNNTGTSYLTTLFFFWLCFPRHLPWRGNPNTDAFEIASKSQSRWKASTCGFYFKLKSHLAFEQPL